MTESTPTPCDKQNTDINNTKTKETTQNTQGGRRRTKKKKKSEQEQGRERQNQRGKDIRRKTKQSIQGRLFSDVNN